MANIPIAGKCFYCGRDENGDWLDHQAHEVSEDYKKLSKGRRDAIEAESVSSAFLKEEIDQIVQDMKDNNEKLAQIVDDITSQYPSTPTAIDDDLKYLIDCAIPNCTDQNEMVKTQNEFERLRVRIRNALKYPIVSKIVGLDIALDWFNPNLKISIDDYIKEYKETPDQTIQRAAKEQLRRQSTQSQLPSDIQNLMKMIIDSYDENTKIGEQARKIVGDYNADKIRE